MNYPVLVMSLVCLVSIAQANPHDQQGLSMETTLGLGTTTLTQGDTTLDASVATLRVGAAYHKWKPSFFVVTELNIGQPHLHSSEISRRLGRSTSLMQSTVQIGTERKLGPWLGRASVGPTYVALASPRLWSVSNLGWKTEVGLGKWFALPGGFRVGGRANASLTRVTDFRGAWWGRSMDMSVMFGFD